MYVNEWYIHEVVQQINGGILNTFVFSLSLSLSLSFQVYHSVSIHSDQDSIHVSPRGPWATPSHA